MCGRKGRQGTGDWRTGKRDGSNTAASERRTDNRERKWKENKRMVDVMKGNCVNEKRSVEARGNEKETGRLETG